MHQLPVILYNSITSDFNTTVKLISEIYRTNILKDTQVRERALKNRQSEQIE